MIDSIAVCMATYNGQMYLAAQIESILGQLGPFDMLIISDDGSTDQTLSICAQYGEKVRVVAHDRVGGAVKNFERALAQAQADAYVLCDQDDVWLPGRIDMIRNYLEHADLVVFNGTVVDAQLKSRGQTVFDLVGMKSGFLSNLVKNSFIGCCMAFRRDLRDRVLPFPDGVPWHDWYIGLVAELVGRVERIDVITLLYRRHGANLSPTGEKSSNFLINKMAMRWFVLRAVLVAVLRARRNG